MTRRGSTAAALALLAAAPLMACGTSAPRRAAAPASRLPAKRLVTAPRRGVRVSPSAPTGATPITVAFRTPIALDTTEPYGATATLRGPLSASCRPGVANVRDNRARRAGASVRMRFGFAAADQFGLAPRTSWCPGRYTVTVVVRHAHDPHRTIGRRTFVVRG